MAKLTEADILVLLSDIDGLYDDNPNTNPDAKLIDFVEEINDDIRALAGDAGSARGTGGMVTKITAATIATEAGIDMYIMNGSDPDIIYDFVDGKKVGTRFMAKK